MKKIIQAIKLRKLKTEVNKKGIEKMCEYCEKGKPLISEERLYSDFEYHKFNTLIWENELITKNENEPCLDVDEKCKINYCPMCGRKLKED